MRTMTIAIPLSILMSVAAAAQEQRKSSTSPTPPSPPATAPGQTGIPQAPVGHRQPTQSTLPPAVRREEDSARREPDPLGPIPNICRNC
jgi:hypothetical protein